MLRRSALTSGMTVLLIAALAAAQERGGFGGRGFGGFGGFGGGRGSTASLLEIPEVQQELRLRAPQKTLLDEALSGLREKMRSSFGNLNNQDLSREERQERFGQARQKMEEANKEADEQIATILDADQTARLDQLRLQREGWAALNRPEIAERLGLDEKQRAQIRTVQEQASRQGRGGFGGGNQAGGDGSNFFARMQEQREKMQVDILAVLTDQQKESWEQMKGPKFEFPIPRGFGGFGGRGGNAGERRRPPLKQRDQ